MKFGTDPEFMLLDKNGVLTSAIGIVKGTKEKKLHLGDGYYAFYDNVNLEVNIPPINHRDDVINVLQDCFQKLRRIVHPNQFLPISSATFPSAALLHPDAQIFGCDPEFCAYKMDRIIPPVSTTAFRSAGGHIHLGDDEGNYPLTIPMKGDDATEREWGRIWVVRMLDLFLGLPSILIDHDITSPARRKLYGKAGSHRPKEYGVEYRTLGNFWLSKPQLALLIYDIAAWTVEFVACRGYQRLWSDQDTCFAYNVEDLKTAINDSSFQKAGELMNKVVKQFLPHNIYQQIFTYAEPTGNNFRLEWGL